MPIKIKKKRAASTPKKLAKNIFIGDLRSVVFQSNMIPNQSLQNRAILLLGSNAPDALFALGQAREALQRETEIVLAGSLWRSAAWGFEGPDFINQAVEVTWEGDLSVFMTRCIEIEKKLGRVRNTAVSGYENRRIDLDIILWEGGVYVSENLIVPHPRMHIRRFVLHPVAEHWGEWIHPVENLSVRALLACCRDENLVHLHQTTEKY